jgi:hypothetical protein
MEAKSCIPHCTVPRKSEEDVRRYADVAVSKESVNMTIETHIANVKKPNAVYHRDGEDSIS